MTHLPTVRAACALLATGATLAAPHLLAQATTATDAVAAWVHLDAPPGGEQRAIDALRPVLGAGWTSDAFGTLVKRAGSGTPRRVVACAMDVPNFVVSQVTDDGYLRLHRAGVPLHPLWDQFHEAQQVRVLTSRGDVTGVVAITNGHFTRQHRSDTTVTTVDQLWVDVGASSAAEVRALGISLLDPVVAQRPLWTYEGHAAGPGAGARAGCAAVASAAMLPVTRGETIFVLGTQRSFGWVGLAAVLARLGAVDAITLLDDGRAVASDAMVAASQLGGQRKGALARVLRGDSVRVIAPQVRFAGSLVESINAIEASALLSRALRAAGSDATTAAWVTPRIDTTARLAARRDAYALPDSVFRAIADLPAVPGHEFRVREAILALLPPWAKAVAVTDTAGNIVVGAGPERDSVAFIAHMDEVSFEVEGINSDGTVRLTRKGGAVPNAWEGQPSLLHFDRDASGAVAPSIRGVFVPRDSARTKAPTTLVAWYGVDSATLVARGVRPGLGVTAYKRAARLAGVRLSGRGSDDRTGSTALLLAMRRIDPTALSHRVVFVFSTREEGGLFGASAFAAEHGRGLKRVYSIDTFVSSDTPLEQPMFAFTPLGRGAVLRGLDDGSIVPPAERARILRIATVHRIPIQVGTTHGATDGSSVAAFGAPNVGLSWPGRYSHTPGEVLDLRDVDALIRLIAAVAVAP